MSDRRWRMKNMPLAEWSALQERFGELQMASLGNPDLAMFVKGRPGDEQDAVYITGSGIQMIEQASPGRWQDASAPSGAGVSLLVGTADTWERFGIPRQL